MSVRRRELNCRRLAKNLVLQKRGTPTQTGIHTTIENRLGVRRRWLCRWQHHQRLLLANWLEQD